MLIIRLQRSYIVRSSEPPAGAMGNSFRHCEGMCVPVKGGLRLDAKTKGHLVNLS